MAPMARHEAAPMAVVGCSVGRRERYATKQATKSANSFKTSEDAGRWGFVLMNSTLCKSACRSALGHGETDSWHPLHPLIRFVTRFHASCQSLAVISFI